MIRASSVGKRFLTPAQQTRRDLAETSENKAILGGSVSLGPLESVDGKWVLRNIDLEVEPGSLVGVIGASGSGKSTLLKCITGFIPISDGTIEVGDLALTAGQTKDARAAVAVAIRRKVGMVFQHLNLWPYRTALQNIIEGPIYAKGIPRGRAVKDAIWWAKQLGIGDHLDKYPSMLSGGERQRVAIARAVVMEPEFLLLDEITSALDPGLAGEILDIIEGLRKRQGMGIVLVSHQIDFMKRSADRVYFLSDGQVKELGPPRLILEKPKTPELSKFVASIDHGR